MIRRTFLKLFALLPFAGVFGFELPELEPPELEPKPVSHAFGHPSSFPVCFTASRRRKPTHEVYLPFIKDK